MRAPISRMLTPFHWLGTISTAIVFRNIRQRTFLAAMVHKYEPPVYDCSVCGKDVKDHDLGIFNRHQGLHNGTKQFKCEVCDDGFSDRRILERHMGWHGLTRNYVCNKCGDALITDMGLISHRRTCGVDPASKPLFCNHCGWRTANKPSIRNHKCQEALELMKLTEGGDNFRSELAKASLTAKGVPLSATYNKRPVDPRDAAAAGQQQAGLIPALHRELPGDRIVTRQGDEPPEASHKRPISGAATQQEDELPLETVDERLASPARSHQQIEPLHEPDQKHSGSRPPEPPLAQTRGTSEQERRSLSTVTSSRAVPAALQTSFRIQPSPNAVQGWNNRLTQQHAAPNVALNVARWRPHYTVNGSSDTAHTSSSRQVPSSNGLAMVPTEHLSTRHVSSPGRMAATPVVLSSGRMRSRSPQRADLSTERSSPERRSISLQLPTIRTEQTLPATWLPSVEALELPKPRQRNNYTEEQPRRLTPISVPPSNPALHRLLSPQGEPYRTEHLSDYRAPMRRQLSDRALQQALGAMKRRASMGLDDALRVVRQRPSASQSPLKDRLSPTARNPPNLPPLSASPAEVAQLQSTGSASLAQCPSVQSPRIPEPARLASDPFPRPTIPTQLPSMSALRLPLPVRRSSVPGPVPNASSLHPSLTSRQNDLSSQRREISLRQPVSYPPQDSSSFQTLAFSSLTAKRCQACGHEISMQPTTKTPVDIDLIDQRRWCFCKNSTQDKSMA